MRFGVLFYGIGLVAGAFSARAQNSEQPMVPLQAPTRAKATPIAYVQARPLTTVVAESSSGSLKLEDIAAYAKTTYVQPLQSMPPGNVARAPRNLLRNAAEFIAARQRGEAELYATGDPQMIAACTKDFNERVISDTTQYLIKTRIMDKITSPSEEAITQYYKQHEPEFAHPAYFKMRHLILYTYAHYQVAQGDTLEAIAEKVSGNKANADLIRADTQQRPLRRDPKKLFKALVEGELLLVPMNPKEAMEVRTQMEQQLELLKRGMRFEDLCTSYSNADTKGAISPELPAGSRGFLPELLHYGFSTPLNEVSPIFRTKHGWNAIQVVERKTTTTEPLSNLRQEIAGRIRMTQRDKLSAGLNDELLSQQGFEINTAGFRAAAGRDFPSTNTVMFSAGSHTVLWADMRQYWEKLGMPTDPIALRQIFKQTPPVLQAAVLYYADRLAASGEAVPSSNLQARTLVVGDAYIGNVLGEQLKKRITEADMEKYYNTNRDLLYNQPPLVAYVSMGMKIDAKSSRLGGAARTDAMAKAKEALAAKLKPLKSVDEFQRTALEVNAPLTGSPDEPAKSLTPAPMDSIPPEYATQLVALEPGHWSEPFESADSVISVALIERDAKRYRQFTDPEVRDDVRNRMMNALHTKEQQSAIEQDLLKRAKFRFILE